MKLTATERRTLARWYLGGIDAIRTPEFSAKCSTINSLVRKGFVGPSGLTEKGAAEAKQLADAGVC